MGSILQRNNVHTLGRGDRTLLFAHGFGCDQNVWSEVIKAFEDDYKIVLFDYVGAGLSDLSAYDKRKYADLEGYAQDILDICEVLQLKDVVFVGHSVSSMIGVLAANRHPALFKKLIFLGPSPRYLNDGSYYGGFEQKDLDELFEVMENNYLGWSAAMAPAIMANADRPELGKELTNKFCATDPEIARQFARVTFLSDNRSDLSKVKLQSLTLQCVEDIIAPLQVGEYMQREMPGNTLVVLRATGHCPHMSAPKETIAAIKAFI